MRKKKKLFEIKIYEYNTDEIFYRAECQGISIPSKTIRGALNKLMKDLDLLTMIATKRISKESSESKESEK